MYTVEIRDLEDDLEERSLNVLCIKKFVVEVRWSFRGLNSYRLTNLEFFRVLGGLIELISSEFWDLGGWLEWFLIWMFFIFLKFLEVLERFETFECPPTRLIRASIYKRLEEVYYTFLDMSGSMCHNLNWRILNLVLQDTNNII